MVPAPFSGQVARAQGRFTQLFKNQPNCRAILASLLVGFPELNAIFWQIINQRNLVVLTAMVAASQDTGNQLDVIGGLVDEPRSGRSDKEYLPAIKVRIRVNRSQGRAEDIIQIANLLTPSTYSEFPPLKWLVEAWNIQPPLQASTFASLLGRAKASSSRGLIHYSNWDPSMNLRSSSRSGGVTTTMHTASRSGGTTHNGLVVGSIEAKP